MGDWQKGKRGGGGGGGGGGKRGRWHKPSSSSAAIPYGTRGVVVTCEQGKRARGVQGRPRARWTRCSRPSSFFGSSRRRGERRRGSRGGRRRRPPTFGLAEKRAGRSLRRARGGAATAQGGKVRVAAVRVPEPGLQGVRVRAHGRGFGSKRTRPRSSCTRCSRRRARGRRAARGRGSRIRPKVAARPAARPGGRRVLRWVWTKSRKPRRV